MDEPRTTDPASATTFLFVPGDRPERFKRAARSGADLVILDLEDGVAPARRAAAREHVVAWLHGHPEAMVRVNAHGTPDHDLDVATLAGTITRAMLPKAESAASVEAAAAALGAGVDVVALVETAAGVAAAASVAAVGAVVRLAFGNIDLAAELGIDADDTRALLTARSLLVLASASARLHGPVDGVTTTIDADDVALAAAAHAASLGFRGTMCIHPRQLDAAMSGFAPTPEQVRWARDVMALPSKGEARAVDGAMVDRPVEARALDILRRAGGHAQP